MSTPRYEPWGVVSQLQDEINRVFGTWYEGDEGSSATAQWIPAVDVREFRDRFRLQMDLPGGDQKEVEITLDNGVLTVSGERREEKQVEAKNGEEPQLQRTERRLGRF